MAHYRAMDRIALQTQLTQARASLSAAQTAYNAALGAKDWQESHGPSSRRLSAHDPKTLREEVQHWTQEIAKLESRLNSGGNAPLQVRL